MKRIKIDFDKVFNEIDNYINNYEDIPISYHFTENHIEQYDGNKFYKRVYKNPADIISVDYKQYNILYYYEIDAPREVINHFVLSVYKDEDCRENVFRISVTRKIDNDISYYELSYYDNMKEIKISDANLTEEKCFNVIKGIDTTRDNPLSVIILNDVKIF